MHNFFTYATRLQASKLKTKLRLSNTKTDYTLNKYATDLGFVGKNSVKNKLLANH